MWFLLLFIVQVLSRVRPFATPWVNCSMPGFPVLHYLPEFPQTHVYCWWCHPTTSACCPLLLPSIFPSIMVSSNESVLCIRWPKCWSFSFSISPYNGYLGLISFRIDWLDFPAVQGTLSTTIRKHQFFHTQAFFIVQLLHPYMINGKTTTFDYYMDLCQQSNVSAF